MAATGETTTPYRPTGPLDPLAAQIAQAFSAMPLAALPIEQTRAGMRAVCMPGREPEMVQVTDHQVPIDGGSIAVRVYRPVASPAAVLLWAHGGGFALGSIEELDNFARLLAARTACAVASVEYRLAPEHRFPVAVEDVEAATLWLAARIDDFAAPGAPLWLGGDSAGGNLATVVTRRLHAAGSAAAIAGNILVYPCTQGPDAASLDDFASPFMSADDIRWFFGMYMPPTTVDVAAAASDPDFAPMLADDLAGLPPTLVITAEHDLITAQSEAYAERLRDSGVEVATSRVSGMIHGFLTLDAFLPGAAGKAIDTIAAFIAQHRS